MKRTKVKYSDANDPKAREFWQEQLGDDDLVVLGSGFMEFIAPNMRGPKLSRITLAIGWRTVLIFLVDFKNADVNVLNLPKADIAELSRSVETGAVLIKTVKGGEYLLRKLDPYAALLAALSEER